MRPATLAIRKGIGVLRSATMNERIHAAVGMVAEHARQPEGESPFDNLMEVKS